LHVHGFRNFFYFPCPEKPEHSTEAQLQTFVKHINKALYKTGDSVEDISIVQKAPILYYRPTITTLPFFKITSTVSAAQNNISKASMDAPNVSIGGPQWADPNPTSLEDNVNFMS